MATVTKSGNCLIITSTGTQEDILVLSDFQGGPFSAQIKVIAGDFQFNVSNNDDDTSTIDSNHATLTDDDLVILGIGTGRGKIRYKASATAKTFRVAVAV